MCGCGDERRGAAEENEMILHDQANDIELLPYTIVRRVCFVCRKISADFGALAGGEWVRWIEHTG